MIGKKLVVALVAATLGSTLTLSACSAGAPASGTPTLAPAPSVSQTSNIVSATSSASAAYESYHAALQSNEADIAIQMAGLPEKQQYAIALQWEIAPITGDPLQTARAVWASAFFAKLKSAAPPTVVAAAPTVVVPTQEPQAAAASRYQQLLTFMTGCGRPDCPTPTVTVTPTVNPQCAYYRTQLSKDLATLQEATMQLNDVLAVAGRDRTPSSWDLTMTQTYQSEATRAQEDAQHDQQTLTNEHC